MLKTFIITARREFAQLALTPALYAVLAALTILYSYVFYSEMSATAQSHIQPVAFLMGMMSLFLLPIITMRSFAGEMASGTLELLFTTPVRPIAVILGKFCGCLAFYVLSLLPYCGYVIILATYGDVDWGTLITTAISLLLIGAAQTATGIFVSSLTANIIVAAAGSCVLNFFFFMLSLPIERGASVFSFPAHFSWWAHFREIFMRGMVDSRSLIFFATLIALFLFLTWLIVCARGAYGGEKLSRKFLTLSGICALLGGNIFLFAGWARNNFNELFSAITHGDFFRGGLPITLGAILIIAALFFLQRSRRRNGNFFARRSSWRENYPLYLIAFSAVLIFVNLNYFATLRFAHWRTYQRWDLTANQTNTLSPNMQTALDLLTEPLNITVFLSENIDYDNVPLARQVRDLLSEFTSYSAKVKVDFCDAFADAEHANQRAKDLNLPATNLTQLVVVNYGERQQIIGADNFLRPPDKNAQMAGNKTPTFQGELVFAIVTRRLTDRQTTNIYFATQIGEVPAYGAENVYNCAGFFGEALAREAYNLRPWAMTGKDEVPADCDVLIITGFAQPLPENYTNSVESYLARGGRVLLLLPEPNATSPLGVGQNYRTGFEKMLNEIGIRVRGDVIFDEKNNFAGASTQILALLDPSSPITVNAEQTVLVMPHTQSLITRDGGQNDWQLWRVVRSLKTSKRLVPTAKINNPPTNENTEGAATVIVTGARSARGNIPEARIVTAGSVGWASNLFIRREQNQPFLIAAVKWLAGRHYQITDIKMRNYLQYKLTMTPQNWRWTWWLTLVAFPEIWLLLGAGVWWMRKE